MRIGILRKCCIVLAAAGCLYASACIPTKDQIGSMINGGIMSGIQLAITLALQSALTPLLGGTTTTTTA
jgi:hypothetical protein